MAWIIFFGLFADEKIYKLIIIIIWYGLKWLEKF